MAVLERPKLIIPSLGEIYEALSPYMYPIMRVVMGVALVPHGMQKLFGMYGAPPMDAYVKGFGTAVGSWAASSGWVYYIGIIEFFGGICIAIGLLTRVWAVQAVCFMAVAAFIAQWPNGWFWTARGFELPLTWGVIFLVIMVKGGGKWSVDRAIGKEF